MARQRLGLTLLLVVGALVAATPAVASHSTEESATDSASPVQNASDSNVTTVDAMVAAQNATNGTAIGVERERRNDAPVWEVEVLREDGAHFEVDVHAATGAVRDVERGGVESFLPPNRTRSVDDMRSAIEAVEVARNGTVRVPNVARVSLEVENSTLVYEIAYSTPDGESVVHVAAIPGQTFDRGDWANRGNRTDWGDRTDWTDSTDRTDRFGRPG